MTSTDLIALLPILGLGFFCIVMMLAIAVRRHHSMIALIAGLCCLLTLATLPIAATATPHAVTALLMIDGYALLFMGLLLAATAVIITFSYGYLQLHVNEHEEFEEYYLLLLLATFGGLVLVAAVHFVSLFLGLELIGVSLYCLIGYLRTRHAPLEAALKYLILSGFASAFLLFGMGLMYFETGTMAFGQMGARLVANSHIPALWLAGFVLVLVGIGFKLGIVPFHLWIPDVYQGAPVPITAFVATVSKGAVFALLLRFVGDVQALQLGGLGHLFAFLAGSSMFIGNFLALLQHNVKRLLAYSSISHFGYLLVALIAGGPLATEAVAFYLAAYFLTTLGAFGVITVLSGEARDADAPEDYHGLFWTQPWWAGTFALMLLSLAGIPLTAGFVGKFYAITAGLDAKLQLLVALLVINSAIGLYYYLRLILIMFEEPVLTQDEFRLQTINRRIGNKWIIVPSLGFVTVMLLWLGIYPGVFMEFIRTMISPLAQSIATVPAPPP
jgi:NADH-quinone oxidoreductase subunit N